MTKDERYNLCAAIHNLSLAISELVEQIGEMDAQQEDAGLQAGSLADFRKVTTYAGSCTGVNPHNAGNAIGTGGIR